MPVFSCMVGVSFLHDVSIKTGRLQAASYIIVIRRCESTFYLFAKTIKSYCFISLTQERIPPLVDDFLYICDDAYNRTEFVRMEKDILRTVDFNLGLPISYRFLRRFAKVCVCACEYM